MGDGHGQAVAVAVAVVPVTVTVTEEEVLMGLDDGEWVHGGGPGRDDLDEEWAGAAHEWPAGPGPGGRRPAGSGFAGPGPGGPGFAGRGRRGGGGVPGFSVRVAAVVAVLAAAAGVVVALLVVRGVTAAGAAPSASAPASAAASAPAGGGASLPGLPGLPGSGDGRLQIALTGKVLAVSDRSITIGGNGPSVTAAVTQATKVTGKDGGIGGVRVGDEISAQITGVGSKLTATAIQDPAVQ